MPIDTHGGEAPVASQTSASTSVALDSIKNQTSPGTMSSLAISLGKLATAIATLIISEAKQSQKLTANKIAITRALANIPTVKTPDIKDTTKSINSTLGNTTTDDTIKIQKAIGKANTTPDPSAMSSFTDGMMDHTSAQSQLRLNDLSKSLADVNGMKQLAESKA